MGFNSTNEVFKKNIEKKIDEISDFQFWDLKACG